MQLIMYKIYLNANEIPHTLTYNVKAGMRTDIYLNCDTKQIITKRITNTYAIHTLVYDHESKNCIYICINANSTNITEHLRNQR